MASKRQLVEKTRRMPRQARAEETVAAILEAAAQILEAGGLGAFTTNAVAERAGVSIGTLYQYFADKQAILRAIAERELNATLAKVAGTLTEQHDAPVEARVRAIVRAIVGAFRGRQRARKAVVQAVFSESGGAALQAPVATFITAHALESLSEHQTFVLSRALLGAIRAAVLEEKPFLRDAAFEDELVRLAAGYLRALLPAD